MIQRCFVATLLPLAHSFSTIRVHEHHYRFEKHSLSDDASSTGSHLGIPASFNLRKFPTKPTFTVRAKPTLTEAVTEIVTEDPVTEAATDVEPDAVIEAVTEALRTFTNESEKDEVPKKSKNREKYYIENPVYLDGTKPAGAWELATTNFMKQGRTILQQVGESLGMIVVEDRPPVCLQLTLDKDAVHEAERRREARPGGKVETNVVSRGLYEVGCLCLDALFDGRPIPRFWFLETIARVPYFSYVSMLHLYESFGWWRGAELRKVHTAQEWNELHHLLIMEALGGNALWSDRFIGNHVAIGYYWAVNALFFFSPKAAYEFMELLESHAVDTYSTFVKENAERLKSLPAPKVARSYYKGADLYYFDDFQVSKPVGTRRPPCDNLYDVFKNISEDEGEHVKTMNACQDYARIGKMVVSPHAALGDGTEDDVKRKYWKEWAAMINDSLQEVAHDRDTKN